MADFAELEKQLKKQYVPIFRKMMGMSAAQANKTFKKLYAKIKADAEAEDTLNLPMDLGDRLLQKETEDKKVKQALDKKRIDGVTDDDVRWWWNRHDLARRMMNKVDEVFVYSLFLKLTKQDKMKAKQANEKIKTLRPMFGNPDDTRFGKADDRPLPDELRQRVNAYIMQRGQKGPESLRNAVQACTSYNAFIRKKIKAGKL